MTAIKIINARLITDLRIVNNTCVIVEKGKVSYVGPYIETENMPVIDAKNNYLSPGFIDIHVHGGGGADFMDGTKEAYLTIAETHAKFGTTSMTPTSLSSTNEELMASFQAYESALKENKKGAKFLGIHLEGPYFAHSQKGAQDPRYIKNPEKEDYEKILSLSDKITRWSAAPEVTGGFEFGEYLKNKGILPSIAHTDGIYEEIEEAFERGYTHMTHFYSGMSGVTRRNGMRYAGAVESGYLIDDMTVEIIADGVHLPASLLRLIVKVKSPSKIALVTDAMRAAGQNVSESILGSLQDGTKVIIEDGVAKMPDRLNFAGSIATCDRLVRTMLKLTDVSLVDAVKMMTKTPAKIIGVEQKKGTIAVGKDADLVLFDDDIHIKLTMVEGNIVHNVDENSLFYHRQ
ncbi:MAG: N-acetylglucosamine-6-phosphate deacetylase [Epulopiscium sp.]|nr:N-acetylglucosamine-6-phosphate deacetylase [Candidatus Epulonipiscium sp.]